jgi:hypothetical protein
MFTYNENYSTSAKSKLNKIKNFYFDSSEVFET